MIPQYGPESPFEQTRSETKEVTASAEEIIMGDGKSTLILAVRMGMDGLDSDSFEFTLTQIIPKKFLEFLRDKDTEATLRHHIADYLHEVAEQWRSGAIFRG